MTKTSLEDLDKKLDLIFDKLTRQHRRSEELGNTIESVEKSVSALQIKVDFMESDCDDAYDSINKLVEVKITGITYKKEENLKLVFAGLCGMMRISTRDST
jgi:hypothetical protein